MRVVADAVTPGEFQAAEGVDDWRLLFNGANAYFRTGTFASGLALVDAIGQIASSLAHPPDVDLRPEGVTVVLGLSPLGSLTRQEVETSRLISAAARELGAVAEPGRVQYVQVAIDAFVSPEVVSFWKAVLGYDQVGDEDLLDPRRRGPSIWFQEMEHRREERNRIHVDLCVPHDEAEARIAAALAAGGRIVFERYAPMWWTLADPEGNEVDIATMEGRD
jgi:4a-hydroxytetrahydrobiopterin dehydratase